ELAKSYALHLPEGPERTNVLGQLSSMLMDFKDVAGAVSLVTNLPERDLEDIFAFSGFLQKWMQIDRHAAAALLLDHAPAAIARHEANRTTYSFTSILDS